MKQLFKQIKNNLHSFITHQQFTGLLLIFCAALSLLISNLSSDDTYINFWTHQSIEIGIFSFPMHSFINDFLMTFFFFIAGSEIKTALSIGSLNTRAKALLPFIAAIGGMVIPALIYFAFNCNSTYSKGLGIPMATDIAFALAIILLLKKHIPIELKIILVSLAVIDDLGAIAFIATFYTQEINWAYFTLSLLIILIIWMINKLDISMAWIYILLGFGLMFSIHRAGIHPSIAGVVLALMMPFDTQKESNMSQQLEHALHVPVMYFILPIFVLSNTAMIINTSSIPFESLEWGILLGLTIGKPLGVVLFTFIFMNLKIIHIPKGVHFKHIVGIGILAGIGFTMSIFISNLAFTDPSYINRAKLFILISSLISGLVGYFYLLFIKE